MQRPALSPCYAAGVHATACITPNTALRTGVLFERLTRSAFAKSLVQKADTQLLSLSRPEKPTRPRMVMWDWNRGKHRAL